jgi:hypothetical protein
MSYILEGLKKLEQKRKQEEKLPHSLSVQTDGAVKSSKTPIWVYLLVAVLLLNAGVIIWWIGPWRATKQTASEEQSGVKKVMPTYVDNLSTKQSKWTKPFPVKEPEQKKATIRPFTGDAGKKTRITPTPVTKETSVSGQSPRSRSGLSLKKANHRRTGAS